jgi:enoyl-CoA hydratase
MSFNNLQLETRDGVAVLTVNRPKVLNALNAETIAELDAAISQLAADSEVRAVVLTGAGEKAFVAGADINELARSTPVSGRETALRGQSVLGRLETMGKPVLAAINGFALGGGLELALACHLRLAVEEAKLGLPEVKLGIIPGYGGTQRLARLVGKGRALEWILSGEMMDAAEAHRIGLVNRVFPRAELLPGAEALLRKILANGPVAIRYALEAVTRGLEGTLEEGLALEASLFGLSCATEDMREGTGAFLEKRPAQFKGK